MLKRKEKKSTRTYINGTRNVYLSLKQAKIKKINHDEAKLKGERESRIYLKDVTKKKQN